LAWPQHEWAAASNGWNVTSVGNILRSDLESRKAPLRPAQFLAHRSRQ
jgi:hypothetical protein